MRVLMRVCAYARDLDPMHGEPASQPNPKGDHELSPPPRNGTGPDPNQSTLFELADIEPADQKTGTYYCRHCGSPYLRGVQPTVDTKRRWAIAARCLGCDRVNVIALRD